jgi:tetratricopeptide (TPR) repeat protein
VEKTFGKPVAELDAEWRAYLATIPVPAAKKTAARERFTQPSLFERPCARELARLEEEGWARLRANRFDEANASFEAWRSVDERPEPVRALFYVAKRRKDAARADALAAKLLEMEIEGSPMWWRARIQRAEIAWEAGRLEDAETALGEVLAAGLGTDLEREAWIKREAVRRGRAGDADFAAAVLGWFDATASRDAQVVALTSATEHASGTSRFVGAYLLGRGLLGSGEPEIAAAWLNRAAQAADGVDSAPLLAELQALRADALTRTGRLDEAAAAWNALLALPAPPDARARAEDGLARLGWLARPR